MKSRRFNPVLLASLIQFRFQNFVFLLALFFFFFFFFFLTSILLKEETKLYRKTISIITVTS